MSYKSSHQRLFFLSFLFLFLLTSCSSMRRSSEVNKNMSDFAINNSINLELFKDDVELLGDVCFRVFEGRVLLACTVPTEEAKQRAERIVRGIKGVSKVYNHIAVGKKGTVGNYVQDSYISTSLSTSLMVMGEILRDNYTFEVVNGVVYLLGKAPNEEMRQRVIDKARGISGVEKVVSYIILEK